MKIKNFPLIDNTYFGGNQAWMREKRHAAGGCGVIAAANLVHYYRGIETVSKDTYMVAVDSLYHWLSPLHLFNPFAPENTLGLPFFKQYMHRLAQYLEIFDIDREPELFRANSYLAAEEFIRRSISQADPVIVLLIGHRRLKLYNNHYMTITGFEEDGFLLQLSTWGAEEKLPLKELYFGATIFRLGRLKAA